MGLSATVYRNAESVLQTLPHSDVETDPETGEVIARAGNPDLPLEHTVSASKFLGNVDTIAALREYVSENDPTLAVILECILYDGSHTGDLISSSQVPDLEKEMSRAKNLLVQDDEGLLAAFLADLEALIDAAKRERNPIVFT